VSSRLPGLMKHKNKKNKREGGEREKRKGKKREQVVTLLLTVN
jgi:hypothetical protein